MPLEEPPPEEPPRSETGVQWKQVCMQLSRLSRIGNISMQQREELGELQAAIEDWDDNVFATWELKDDMPEDDLRVLLGWVRRKVQMSGLKLPREIDAAESSRPMSPRSELEQWCRHYELPHNVTLQQLPDGLTAAQLKALVQAMPLPPQIGKTLLDHIYVTPADTLFVCNTTDMAQACPRDDLVEQLLECVTRLPTCTTVLVYGPHRWGKSFSMSWAQLTAMQRLRVQQPQAAPGMYTEKFLVYLPCHEMTEPSKEDLMALLVAMAYLRLPVVFDEHGVWANLAPVLEAFLSSGGPSSPQLAPVRLQFILQTSFQGHFTKTAGQHGYLYRRSNVGVDTLIIKRPPIHLFAGILQAVHPQLYPQQLLRVLCSTGFKLDRLITSPLTPLKQLHGGCLRDEVMLEEQHLAALETIMRSGTVAQDKATTQLMQLVSAGLVEPSPLEPERLFLCDPKLLTLQTMASACSLRLPEDDLEKHVQDVEGMVLEVLGRSELGLEVLRQLGLQCDCPPMWWGNLGRAELDLIVPLPSGPLILLSCKRSQKAQELKAFHRHLHAIKDLAKAVMDAYEEQKLKQLSDKQRAKMEREYDSHPAVRIVRSMHAGKGVTLVAVSVVPCDKPWQPTDEALTTAMKLEVPCTCTHMLMHELVRPVPAQPLHVAKALKLVA